MPAATPSQQLHQQARSTSTTGSIRSHYINDGVHDYYSKGNYANPHEIRVNELFKYVWRHWNLWRNWRLNCRLTSIESDSFRLLDLSAGNGEMTNAFLEMLWEEEEDQGTEKDSSRYQVYGIDPYTYAQYNKRFQHLKKIPTSGILTASKKATKKKQQLTGKNSKNSNGNVLSNGFHNTSAVREFLPIGVNMDTPPVCLPISYEDILNNGLHIGHIGQTGKIGQTAQIDEKGEENNSSSTNNSTNIVFDLCVCSYALHLADAAILPVLALQLALSCRRILILTPHKRPILEEDWGWKKEREMVWRNRDGDRARAVLYKSCMVEGDLGDVGETGEGKTGEGDVLRDVDGSMLGEFKGVEYVVEGVVVEDAVDCGVEKEDELEEDDG